jgi:hypothetical protein
MSPKRKLKKKSKPVNSFLINCEKKFLEPNEKKESLKAAPEVMPLYLLYPTGTYKPYNSIFISQYCLYFIKYRGFRFSFFE